MSMDLADDPSVRSAKRRASLHMKAIATKNLSDLRDDIARDVLSYMLMDVSRSEHIESAPHIAKIAYRYADEMIKARGNAQSE